MQGQIRVRSASEAPGLSAQVTAIWAMRLGTPALTAGPVSHKPPGIRQIRWPGLYTAHVIMGSIKTQGKARHYDH
jgi:hypothetical protein